MATKKKVLKQIRAIANQMPPIEVIKTFAKQKIHGSDLISSGVSKLQNGDPVEPDKYYAKKVPVRQPINHVKQMKNLYKKHKGNGVNAYINAVKNHVKPKPKPE